MAVVTVLAASALLYALNSEKLAATSKETAAALKKKADWGLLATQEAVWDREMFRPYYYGREPFARRRAIPRLSTTRNIAEDVSLRLTPEFKLRMQQGIDNTEWDEVPFRGERASRWAARDRRRLPIINHPNSEQAWIKIPQEAADVVMVPPYAQPTDVRAFNLARLNHPLLSISMKADTFAPGR
jgi:hypothetical protein